MLPANPARDAHLAQDARRLTICGIVEKSNGDIIRCTQHDEDIRISSGDFAGTYFSTAAITASDMKFSSDMSVDNLEISGAIADGFQITGFEIADIAAGLFRSAPFQVFVCQWDDADSWQDEINRGYLGQITRTAEGAFTAEWRGLFQVLQQNVGRVYGTDCDVVRFGDSRCTIDVTPLTVNATVTSVISRREIIVSMTGLPSPAPAAGYFEIGELAALTGSNGGYTKQVKRDSIGGTLGHLQVWENFPKDFQISDTLTIIPGCKRRFEDCQFWNNVNNFRGHGRWIPGMPKIIRAP